MLRNIHNFHMLRFLAHRLPTVGMKGDRVDPVQGVVENSPGYQDYGRAFRRGQIVIEETYRQENQAIYESSPESWTESRVFVFDGQIYIRGYTATVTDVSVRVTAL